MMRWIGGKWLRMLALRPEDTLGMPRNVPAQVQADRSKWDFSGNHHSRGELTAHQRESIGRLRARHCEDFPGYVPPIPDEALTPEERAELGRLRGELADYSFVDFVRDMGDDTHPAWEAANKRDMSGDVTADTAPTVDTMPSPVAPEDCNCLPGDGTCERCGATGALPDVDKARADTPYFDAVLWAGEVAASMAPPLVRALCRAACNIIPPHHGPCIDKDGKALPERP